MLFTLEPGIQFGEFEAKEADGTATIIPNTSDGLHASFPNGRFLTDDVADRLARYGDTLLKELSYLVPPCQDTVPPNPAKPECGHSSWPRITVNDKLFQGQKTSDDRVFEGQFPYLAPRWEMPDARLRAPPLALHMSTVMSIGLTLLVVALLWIGSAWLLALWIDRKRQQRRYL
jgi:hypothetical protein